MASSTLGSEPPGQGVAEPLYQVKLLAALRSGDPTLIHPFLTELGRDKRKSAVKDIDIGAAALHLAIRCAACDTIQLLLSHRAISPNAVHPPGSGTTALHLAASIGRADVVTLLLEQNGIDDTLRDSNGRTCKDVARGKDVMDAIRDSRALLTASYRSLLHSYIHSPPNSAPPPDLLALLSSSRVRLVDLSYLDSSSGRTLLHEAARRKDLRLIELSVRAGADVFVRDRRGKGVGEGEGVSKDDKVRVFLRQFTNQDTTLIDVSTNEPPTLKGYLNKYTNVAKGYNTRWFVLKDGILSYYRHQEDENIASRGSIAMKTAVLNHNTATGSDKLRFEIHSTPSRSGSSSGQQKWYMKGNHAVEVNRWTQAITRSIEWYKREARGASERGSLESESDKRSLKSIHTSLRDRASILSPRKYRRRGKNRSSASSSAETMDEQDERHGSREDVSVAERKDPESRADDSSDAQSERAAPHEAAFALHGNSMAAQVELTTQLLSNFTLPDSAPPQTQEMRAALRDSLSAAQRMMNEYLQMVREREEWWNEKLEKERERGALWEESLQIVVKEGDALERELRSTVRGKNRVPTDASVGGRISTIRKSSAQARSILSPASQIVLEQPPTPKAMLPDASTPTASTVATETQNRTQAVSSGPAPTYEQSQSPPEVTSPPPFAESDSVVDTDEEDEFFDAIESNNLPNLVVTSALTSLPDSKIPPSLHTDQYVAYTKLRERLPIDKDTRPPTSLWSVLKHSIGKDLTKISFPVFFNEPTSMLQRMAEDMEFTECLDAAAAEADPHIRLAFVAAFAMSNYSSTIGRIAKPFNPMLSETFEYVRLDKRYRYFSEQVSHHPPMSACWAESPNWAYYGEVDAQNKFMGKSFEIRPTGVAHAELVIPEKFGPDYPRAERKPLQDGKVIEHYTWKKVTTNVSGFILGSPTIDHYGEMTVMNHRTQDKCVLTFKPRGWRGKDAFEIYGRVMDASDNVTYEIAGRWNSQLVARAVGTGFGILHPDVSVTTPSSTSASTEFILLWRNTEKPQTPFNLTPFAITLNDCPEDTLKPYLCPTDCRLRPDQRAFELGKYDRANELKNLQEEFQRATRRAREEGRVPPHKARWFEVRTDGDTGERVWEPVRSSDGELEYWKERERVWREKGQWRDVDRIFIEDRP